MVHGKNRIPYWIDRRLSGLAEPDYDTTISSGLPIEPEDSQYGEYRLRYPNGVQLDEATIEQWVVHYTNGGTQGGWPSGGDAC